jgi:hypothetical protein
VSKIISIKQLAASAEEGAFDVRANPLDEARVALYVDQMNAGAVFPPITVVSHGSFYIVEDGRHRLEAYRRRGKKSIEVIEKSREKTAAMRLAALAANLNNGKSVAVPPTRADITLTVHNLLRDGLKTKEVIEGLVTATLDRKFAESLVRRVINDNKQRAKLNAAQSVESWLETDGAAGLDIEAASEKYSIPVAEIETQIKMREGKENTRDYAQAAALQIARIQDMCGKNVTSPEAWKKIRIRVAAFHRWALANEAKYS